MDVDLQVEDLTGSEVDNEETSGGEVVSSPLGSSSDLRSSRSSLYDNDSQSFLSVTIVNVDGDPTENVKLLPVCGLVLAMFPGPSILRSLIPIEEEVDINNDVWFIPPFLRGDDVARLEFHRRRKER